MFILILGLITLFATTSAYAVDDFIPEFVVFIYSPYLSFAFIIGFALEYLCMCILAHATTRKLLWDAFKCTFFMNLVIILAKTFYFIFLLYFWILMLLPYVIAEKYPLIALSISLIMTTFIKAWFPFHYFTPDPSCKKQWQWNCKVFFWTFMANVLSNAVFFIVAKKNL